MKLIHAALELAPTAVALRVAAAAIVLWHFAPDSAAQHPLWLRQIGTSAADTALAGAADGAGGTYVGGGTKGGLAGANAGSTDAWLARYDGAGNQAWLRQIGGSNSEDTFAVAADGSSGVFACGATWSDMGGPQAGLGDAWLARFDGAGHPNWLVQFGSSMEDRPLAAASDGSGGVYLSGSTQGHLGGTNPKPGTYDAWLARFDNTGKQAWIVQLGTTADDQAYAAAADGAGGVYVAGRTNLDLAGPSAGFMDAWLARYDGTGTLVWIRQFGSSESDIVMAALADGAGGVYLAGDTNGSLGAPNAGFGDPWFARYDAIGNQLWIRQIGTDFFDGAHALAPNGAGGIFLTGFTHGALGGPGAGFADAWMANYDGAGNALALQQFGTALSDTARVAVADSVGGVFVGGTTEGSLPRHRV